MTLFLVIYTEISNLS